MHWTPHVTVASVIERHGKFLIVEEEVEGKVLINQPAGHWEPNETLPAAARRETLEETGWHFTPTHLLGVYHWHSTSNNKTFLRFAFVGELGNHDAARPLDEGIIAAKWLTLEELKACRTQHRSPLILLCVEDYLAGKRLPLHSVQHIE